MIHPNYPTALLFSKPLAVFQIPPAGARLLTRAKTNVCSMFALRELATAGTIRSASHTTAPPGRALRGFEASHKGWGFICREQKPPQTWTSWNRVYNFPTSAAAAVQLASVFIALSRTNYRITLLLHKLECKNISCYHHFNNNNVHFFDYIEE